MRVHKGGNRGEQRERVGKKQGINKLKERVVGESRSNMKKIIRPLID